nr:YheC/YheD family protein [Neobacillus sp. Marseille-Q6967]
MKHIIKTIPSSKPTISFPLSDLEKLSLSGRESIIVSIGAMEIKAFLRHHDVDSYVYVSTELVKNFTLPENVQYEMKINNGKLLIGPVIGILIKGKTAELTKQRVKIYKNYLFDYQHLNGLVLLFASDGIDVLNKQIHGFAYNPLENEWVKGIYPFPTVAFIRKSVKESTRQKLNELIGENFFNSHVFNKWEMWKWFSQQPLLREHFPETVMGDNIEEVKRLIEFYHDTFIKPVAGMQGTGIYQLSKSGHEFKLSYRVKDQNIMTIFDNWNAAECYLKTELNLNKYIVQQRIPLLTRDQRVMDLRVIVVKNQHGKWAVPGMVTKFGDKDSIVSNISSGGSAQKVWQSLCEIFSSDFKRAYKKYMEIEKLAITCCEFLEKRGLHLGYIGIDIGMDQNHGLWVIEINHRNPDMTIALDASDFQLYYKVKTAPLQYAKWLAGFGGEQTNDI